MADSGIDLCSADSAIDAYLGLVDSSGQQIECCRIKEYQRYWGEGGPQGSYGGDLWTVLWQQKFGASWTLSDSPMGPPTLLSSSQLSKESFTSNVCLNQKLSHEMRAILCNLWLIWRISDLGNDRLFAKRTISSYPNLNTRLLEVFSYAIQFLKQILSSVKILFYANTLN